MHELKLGAEVLDDHVGLLRYSITLFSILYETLGES